MDSELKKLISDFKSGAAGEILKTQATYLDIVYSKSSEFLSTTYRIHFIGKHEFLVAKGTVTSFELFVEHPLLVEYQEARQNAYFSSGDFDKQQFILDLEKCCQQKFGRWRSLDRYTNSQMGINELLDQSNGLLMSVPASFIEMVLNVAEKYKVSLSVLECHNKTSHPQLLLLGSYYIVADSFRAERLRLV